MSFRLFDIKLSAHGSLWLILGVFRQIVSYFCPLKSLKTLIRIAISGKNEFWELVISFKVTQNTRSYLNLLWFRCVHMFWTILADWDHCYRFWTFLFNQKPGYLFYEFWPIWGALTNVFALPLSAEGPAISIHPWGRNSTIETQP